MGYNKTDYIRVHGEAAWELEKERRNKKDRERYLTKERERRIQWQRDYNEKHREEINKRQRHYDPQYYSTKRGRAAYLVSGYRCMDKNRGLGETTLTQKWIMENIFTSKCVYCGNDDWKELGCDRIDNTKPHTPDNVVCSCFNCNNQRSNRWSVEEFVKIKTKKE